MKTEPGVHISQDLEEPVLSDTLRGVSSGSDHGVITDLLRPSKNKVRHGVSADVFLCKPLH